MKKIFSINYSQGMANIWLLIFRIATAGFMLTHGYPKFLRLLSGENIKFADPFSIGSYSSFVLVVIAEFICSILIILGLGTRISAFILAINMAVAAFYAHAADPFAKKELALMYLLLFITILIFGPGKYAVDYAIAGKVKSRRY